MSESSVKAIEVRLEAIEREIALLKRKLAAPPLVGGEVKLEGVWKDIEVTDEEIQAVKTSWKAKLDDIV